MKLFSISSFFICCSVTCQQTYDEFSYIDYYMNDYESTDYLGKRN